jgi:hypothetical protein
MVGFEDIFDEDTVTQLLTATNNEDYVTILRSKIDTFINIRAAEAMQEVFYTERDAARVEFVAAQKTALSDFDAAWSAREEYAKANNWDMSGYTE